jgi:hypothetical protein
VKKPAARKTAARKFKGVRVEKNHSRGNSLAQGVCHAEAQSEEANNDIGRTSS